jgi:hypothetical protein
MITALGESGARHEYTYVDLPQSCPSPVVDGVRLNKACGTRYMAIRVDTTTKGDKGQEPN